MCNKVVAIYNDVVVICDKVMAMCNKSHKNMLQKVMVV